MNDMSVTVTAPIDFWTHYRASRAVVNRTWGTTIGWAFFVGVPALILVFGIGTDREISTPVLFGLPGWTTLIGGLLFMMVFMPLLHLFNVWSYRSRSRAVAGVHTYTVAPDGYSVSGGLFDTKLKWEAILKAVETRRFILLYIASRWAHFIPKTTVTADELSKIRAILHEKLGPRAKLQKQAGRTRL